MYSPSLHTNDRVISRIPLARAMSDPFRRRPPRWRPTRPTASRGTRARRRGGRSPRDGRRRRRDGAVAPRACRSLRECAAPVHANGNPWKMGPSRCPACCGHGADDGVDERLVADDIAVRTVGTEPRDRAVTRRGLRACNASESRPRRLGDAGSPALDEHVGALGEAKHVVALGRVLEVEHEAALAAAEHRHGRRVVASGGIATWRLHPHDVGAVVGEEPGGLRAGRTPGAIDDPEPGEWRSHVLTLADRSLRCHRLGLDTARLPPGRGVDLDPDGRELS